jgi:hypothetical protein
MRGRDDPARGVGREEDAGRPAGGNATGTGSTRSESRDSAGVSPDYYHSYDDENNQHHHFHLPVNPGLLRIEPGRLRRARKLWILRIGPRQYAVQGSREIMFVDMHGDEPCYCEDALLDDEPWVCKHILRALIKEKHPKVMAFMEQEDEMEEQRNRWAHEG